MNLNTPLFYIGKVSIHWGRIILWTIGILGLIGNYYVWEDSFPVVIGIMIVIYIVLMHTVFKTKKEK